MPQLIQGGFSREHGAFFEGTDKSPYFGKEFTGWDGTRWRLVAQNDLKIGYYVMVVRGKAQKTRYCCDHNVPEGFWDAPYQG